MWVSRTLKCPLTIHGLDSGESHESRWRRSDVWLARCGLLCLISFAQLYLTLCDSMDCACQAPLSMEFSRQKYWSGLPFPSPGDLPSPKIEPPSLVSPTLAVDSLPLGHLGGPSSSTKVRILCSAVLACMLFVSGFLAQNIEIKQQLL